MKKSDLKCYTDWFYDYIAGFFGDDEYINANLELKKVHTGFVVKEVRYIAAGIGLDGDIMADFLFFSRRLYALAFLGCLWFLVVG